MLGEQPDFSSCARRRAMHITFTLLWQAAQLDLTSQRIDDPQHMFESTGRLANVQVNNEVHTFPCLQCQLLLCQRKLLASTTQRSALAWRHSQREWLSTVSVAVDGSHSQRVHKPPAVLPYQTSVLSAVITPPRDGELPVGAAAAACAVFLAAQAQNWYFIANITLRGLP